MANGKDLDSFRAAYSRKDRAVRAVREGLKALGESWEYESDFIKRCKLSTTDFCAAREGFMDHSIEVRAKGRNTRRVWAGTAAFAKKMREAIQ